MDELANPDGDQLTMQMRARGPDGAWTFGEAGCQQLFTAASCTALFAGDALGQTFDFSATIFTEDLVFADDAGQYPTGDWEIEWRVVDADSIEQRFSQTVTLTLIEPVQGEIEFVGKTDPTADDGDDIDGQTYAPLQSIFDATLRIDGLLNPTDTELEMQMWLSHDGDAPDQNRCGELFTEATGDTELSCERILAGLDAFDGQGASDQPTDVEVFSEDITVDAEVELGEWQIEWRVVDVNDDTAHWLSETVAITVEQPVSEP